MATKSTIKVKICGLKTPQMVTCAAEAGADFIGFNHFAKSPRFVTPADAKILAATLSHEVQSVSLLVDPTDDEVLAAGFANWLQLHGNETPQRVADIARLSGQKIIKVISISQAADIEAAAAYKDVAQMLLFDTKPPKNTDGLPGGNGIAFDWHLLQNASPDLPWMLAGGLTVENVAEAIATTKATCVDVSSGIESKTGVKSKDLIEAFITAVKKETE